ncbi:hypothetical protein P3S67_012561 [Capsicum chacoense]
MAKLAKIGKIGFSLIEERNSKGRTESCSGSEEPKQACVYRYYPHPDHFVQVIPPSATTEARVILSQFPESKATVVSF